MQVEQVPGTDGLTSLSAPGMLVAQVPYIFLYETVN